MRVIFSCYWEACKCKYSLVSNASSSRLSGSLAQLISQASRIFLWCQLLLFLRIVAWSHAISWFVFIKLSASANFSPCRRATAFWCFLFLVMSFLAFRQCNSCCNQRKGCRKQDHEFCLCPFGLSVLETPGLLSDGVWMPLWMPWFSKTLFIGSEVPLTYGIVLYPHSDCAPVVMFFNGGLGLLASKVKRLGYPLDCNVDVTRCFSLNWSDFVVGIFAARSVNDLTGHSLLVHTGMVR